MINSHIILPKFLLKNFEIGNIFWYYDIDGSFIARGNASSFNTEKGYYSDKTEEILNYSVETPFSNLLNNYLDSIFHVDEFEISPSDIGLIKRFFYSLLCRNPYMVKQVNDHSVFFQFLPGVDQHGYAAITGIQEGEKTDLFKEYEVAFYINLTETPFVLPNCGIYSLIIRSAQSIVFPASPRCLFALEKNQSLRKENVIELQRGAITEDIVVRRMNMQALKQQVSLNSGGRIICSQRKELERLKEECLTGCQ